MPSNQRARLRTAAVAVVIVALVGAAGAYLLREPSTPAETASGASDAPPVEVAAAMRGDLESTVTYSSSISAARQVTLSPRLSGQIATMLVDEGSVVRAGQLLASLDAATLPAQVQQSQAAVAAAQARLSLLQDGATTAELAAATQAVLAGEAALTNAQSTVDSLQARTAVIAGGQAVQQQKNEAEAQLAAAAQELEAALVRVEERDAFNGRAIRSAADELESRIRGRCEATGNGAACLTAATGGTDLQSLVIALDNATPKIPFDFASSLATFANIDAGPDRAAIDSAMFRWLRATASLPGLTDQVNGTNFTLGALGAPRSSEVAAAVRTRDAARAALDAARARLDALRDGPTNADELQSRAALAQAQAQLAASQTNLGLTGIVAPFDGVIAERMSDVGASVSPATPVFLLTTKAVELRVAIDEARLGLLRPDLEANVTVPSFPGERFPGKVVSISPVGGERAHTFEVRVLAEDPAEKLRPGMSARVSIVTGTATGAVIVPASAVVTDAEGPMAYRVVGDHVERRRIKTGIFNETSVVVTDGLATGDQVVIGGQQFLSDGQRVRITATAGDGSKGTKIPAGR